MKITSKFGVIAVAVALSSAAQAAFINGAVSFSGGYVPQTSGGVATTLSSGSQLAFNGLANPTIDTTNVNNSSFDLAVPVGTVVSMFTPLVYNPATVPAGNLWSYSFAGNTYSFKLSSLMASPVSNVGGIEALTLSGSGTVSKTGFQDTLGTWLATFNGASTTFSFSASSIATGRAVPDGGTSVALLGGALLGLAGLRRKFSRR